jgi:coenzyme PQQ precursor peptide PqqA
MVATLSIIAIPDIGLCVGIGYYNDTYRALPYLQNFGQGYIMQRRRPQWARKEESMAWTTPTLVEICIGLEINGYLPAEF